MAVGLYVTERCLQNCKFCFNWKVDDKSKPVDMNVEDAFHILKISRENGQQYVTITGGEPFLHPNITEIIDYAHDLGFRINILTNGLLIDESILDRIKGKFRLRFRVSLDGASKKTHEYFRGENTFERVINAIRLLISHGIHVGMGCTVYKENLEDIEKIVKLCIDLGIGYVRFSPVVRIEKGKNAAAELNLHEMALIRIIESQLKYKSHIDLQGFRGIRASFPIECLSTKRCEAGINFFAINPEKVILPCPLIRPHPNISRKKFEGKDDFNILGNDMNGLFDEISGNLRGACGSCSFKESCCGGCLAEKISFDLDLADEQPVCMKRILHRVEGKIKGDDFKVLMNHWMDRLNFPGEMDGDKTKFCFRHAPYWTVIFKRVPEERR